MSASDVLSPSALDLVQVVVDGADQVHTHIAHKLQRIGPVVVGGEDAALSHSPCST